MSLAELFFRAFCRTARALFDVPAASAQTGGPGLAWHDFAEGLEPGRWEAVMAALAEAQAEEAIFWTQDIQAEAALAGLPAVAALPGGQRLRFAAAVAFGPQGQGRLILADTRPRVAASGDAARLADLGTMAGQWLALDRQAREAAEGEVLFRLLAETSTDTIVRGDLNGVRLYVSPSVRDLLGYEPDELTGRQAMDLTHPDDVPAFGALMQAVRQGRLDVGVRELRQRHANGSWVWMEASVRLTHDQATGQANGYVASVRAVGQRKELEARLSRLASYDELTGLPNRSAFTSRLGQALEAVRRDGRRFALFYLDLDGFKQVNDSLGHQAGDAVLREAAARFRAVLRADDAVSRLGGDEFAALLEAGCAEATGLARRLIAAIAEPFCLGEAMVSIGVSIGIAFAPQDAAVPDELLSRADQALYAAKASGRNTYCLFNRPAVCGA